MMSKQSEVLHPECFVGVAIVPLLYLRQRQTIDYVLGRLMN